MEKVNSAEVLPFLFPTQLCLWIMNKFRGQHIFIRETGSKCGLQIPHKVQELWPQ